MLEAVAARSNMFLGLPMANINSSVPRVRETKGYCATI